MRRHLRRQLLAPPGAARLPDVRAGSRAPQLDVPRPRHRHGVRQLGDESGPLLRLQRHLSGQVHGDILFRAQAARARGPGGGRGGEGGGRALAVGFGRLHEVRLVVREDRKSQYGFLTRSVGLLTQPVQCADFNIQ